MIILIDSSFTSHQWLLITRRKPHSPDRVSIFSISGRRALGNQTLMRFYNCYETISSSSLVLFINLSISLMGTCCLFSYQHKQIKWTHQAKWNFYRISILLMRPQHKALCQNVGYILFASMLKSVIFSQKQQVHKVPREKLINTLLLLWVIYPQLAWAMKYWDFRSLTTIAWNALHSSIH